jgi:insulin receptor
MIIMSLCQYQFLMKGENFSLLSSLVNIAGSIVTELEKNLAEIEEIDGHLKIHRSYPLVSLYFFKNLKLITGSSKDRQDYTFLVNDNVNMKDLFDWKSRNGSKLEIRKGKIFIANNPKLCLKKIELLKNYSNIQEWSDTDVNPHTNGDREACETIDMSIKINIISPETVMVVWKNVKLLLHDPRSLIAYTIFWRTTSSPSHNVSKYEGKDACSLKNDIWDTHDVSEGLEGTEMTTILPRLTPATRYAMYIQSYMASTANKGAESDVIYFETLPDKPSDPQEVQGRGINESTIEISWKKPKKPNGKVTHYILNVQPVPQMKEPERDYCEYDATGT